MTLTITLNAISHWCGIIILAWVGLTLFGCFLRDLEDGEVNKSLAVFLLALFIMLGICLL